MFWGEGHVSVFGDTGGVGGEANCSCTLVIKKNNANSDVIYEEVLEKLFRIINL